MLFARALQLAYVKANHNWRTFFPAKKAMLALFSEPRHHRQC
jgi:hypothetical protein